MKALDGIKVLDLSRILAGPWATMTLGDLGAEVWKVEHPRGGDDTRSWSPPQVAGVATYYLTANRNKRSIAVDLATDEGRNIVLKLAERADIVVENFRPASARKLGLTYEQLRKINPRIIHCSISGYGRDNPLEERPGYDFVLQAECGFMAITGEPDGTPMRLGVAFIDLVAGMNATQAILAALYMRERTGLGQSLDIALLDSGLFFLANIASGHLNTGADPKRYGNAHPSIVPYQTFRCRDGTLALAVGNDEQFRRLCVHVLMSPDLADNERFRTNTARCENRAELIPKLEAAFREQAVSSLIELLHRNGIPAGEVKSVTRAFTADAVKYRDLILETPHSQIGTVRTIRNPVRMSASPMSNPTAPPLLGEHTDAVLREVLSYSNEDITSLRAANIIA